MNKILPIIVVLLVIVGGFFALNNYIYQEKQAVVGTDYKNAEYTVDNARIQLVNGVSETEVAPGSASKITTKFFGNEARKDLNNDGVEDVVFLITQQTGGSGTFFYVVAAISEKGGFRGTEAYLLGDRIAPQTTEIKDNNTIVVNFADRAEGEGMATPPSVGKSIYLKLDTTALQFSVVSQNPNSEKGAGTTTLTANSWTWVSALYNDERTVTPKKANTFVLTFSKEGRFNAKTDCNQIAGNYKTTKDTISFSEMISTKMFCEGSQETVFAELITNSSGYHFSNKGELILDLKFDSGSVIFTPADTYTASLNGKITALGVTVVPLEVLEDSRCPADVVCIQAGTVRVKTKLTSASGTADQIFILNKPVTTETEEIALTQVDPYPYSTKTITKTDYVFHFKIVKRSQ